MSPIEDPAASGWKPFANPGGFEGLVGPLWFRSEHGGMRFAFRAEARHANANGVIHGGMMMFFADDVLGATVWHAIGRRPCATVSLNCDFLAPTRPGDWVEGTATIVRKGRTLVFVRGALTVGGGTVLTAAGVWKVIGER